MTIFLRLFGSSVVAVAVLILFHAFRLVAPFDHLIGLLFGPISPSRGNMGVIAGEFLIFGAAAGLTYAGLAVASRLFSVAEAAAAATE